MSNSNNTSKLHLAMFPWFAFGHFIPYLYLSNKLAEKGHRISFLLPRGAQPKVESLSHHPNLIHFFPLVVPHVDGLPPDAETASDVPLPLHNHLALALDQTRDQVETILRTQKPHVVFFDFGYWVPSVVRPMGIKSIYFSIVSVVAQAQVSVPSRKIAKDMTAEELVEVPPDSPCPSIKLKVEESAGARIVLVEDFGTGMSIYKRLTFSLKHSDGVAFRTCREIEGPFCDYFAQQFQKSVLLTGHLLPEIQSTQLEEKWARWLSKYEPGSVVYCALGTQITFERDQFQELLLGFELSGQPFLFVAKPPGGCATVEEAFPEGFQERVEESGWVYDGWVPQQLLLEHPSIGCYVSHNGSSSFWESLLTDGQIVLIPHLRDQILSARFMAEELKVGVEVERGENGWIAKESLSKAIKLVMDKDSEIASLLKSNHTKLRQILSRKDLQDELLNDFITNLHHLIE
ncbi:hypothetical protein SLA2020_158250 [Shorea laevis]